MKLKAKINEAFTSALWLIGLILILRYLYVNNLMQFENSMEFKLTVIMSGIIMAILFCSIMFGVILVIQVIKYKYILRKIHTQEIAFGKRQNYGSNLVRPLEILNYLKNNLKAYENQGSAIFLDDKQEREIKNIILKNAIKLLKERNVSIEELAIKFNFNLNDIRVDISNGYSHYYSEVVYIIEDGIVFVINKKSDDENNEAVLYMRINSLLKCENF